MVKIKPVRESRWACATGTEEWGGAPSKEHHEVHGISFEIDKKKKLAKVTLDTDWTQKFIRANDE